MVANLGYGALIITFLICLYGISAAIYGALRKAPAWVDSARNAMLLTWPLVTLTALCIIYLLLTGHYEVEYVAAVTSNSMPFYLKVTALWGGQAGSLIFWSWLMSGFASAVTLRKWDRDREFLPWVVVVALVTLGFFLSLSIFVENPFTRLWISPTGNVVESMLQPAGSMLFTQADGRGLNPLLRHPGMIIHPPMLYLGFVSFTIPFAFAFASLVTGRSDDRWIRVTRRWTLVAWLFLSLGLILGMRWAYDVLGWGGYWGWDPVEVAALLPWLVGTPFLHSVMIQEKRGLLKWWNIILVTMTYASVLFGTLLTRSGVLSSVHAFAQSAIGPLLFGFVSIMSIITLILLIFRGRTLKSEGHMNSMFSREALFLLNNLLFLALFFICAWGVLFPIISEASGLIGQVFPSVAHIFTGQKITVGPVWFESTTGPIWLALLVLMAVAPLSAWGASTAKTLSRAAWKPAVAALVIAGLLFAAGIRSPLALVAFWAIAFVICATLYEFWREAAARHRTHGENLLAAFWLLAGRFRRRYGGLTIHIGVALMAFGVIGIEMFQTETQGMIAKGEQLSLSGFTIQYDDLKLFPTPDGREVARAELSVFKDGKFVTNLYPRRDFYTESQQSMTIPGVRSTLGEDFYVLLVDWQPVSSSGATFKIYHNPMINWLWLGGFVFILGTLVAAWPDREREVETGRVTRRREAVVSA